MSTVSNGKGMVNYRRRRPRTTVTSAKATCAVFGDCVVIILPIPDFINLYNYCMNGVDKAKQLWSYYFTQRIYRKGWKALWHFLLDVAIMNSYKLYLHAPNHRDAHHDHKHFRKALVTALLCSAERTYIKSLFNTALLIKAVNPLANKYIIGKCQLGYCKACKQAGRRTTASKKRKALEELSINLIWERNNPRAKRTKYSCISCDIPLCRGGTCWDEYMAAVNTKTVDYPLNIDVVEV